MNMMPKMLLSWFFLEIFRRQKSILSPNVICNYNLATKLNFRRLLSLEFTLWRRNLIFVAECNEYGVKNISLQVFSLNI
jgi:hypothetical protein